MARYTEHIASSHSLIEKHLKSYTGLNLIFVVNSRKNVIFGKCESVFSSFDIKPRLKHEFVKMYKNAKPCFVRKMAPGFC